MSYPRRKTDNPRRNPDSPRKDPDGLRRNPDKEQAMFTTVQDRPAPVTTHRSGSAAPGALPTSVDAAAFRDAMAALPAGVTVVTARDADGAPRGFTASAVSSLSLDPPLVLVCVNKSSSMHDLLAARTPFAVNVLACGQESIADRFARRDVERFAGGDFTVDELGPPVLHGAVCQLSCVHHAVVDGGDHSIVVGRVVWSATPGGEPLVYAGRRFRRLA
jgi:flavin reductase ActVB